MAASLKQNNGLKTQLSNKNGRQKVRAPILKVRARPLMKRKKNNNAKHHLLARVAHQKVITARMSKHKKVVMVEERTILLSMTRCSVVKVNLLVVEQK